jgi:hypothetical protein
MACGPGRIFVPAFFSLIALPSRLEPRRSGSRIGRHSTSGVRPFRAISERKKAPPEAEAQFSGRHLVRRDQRTTQRRNRRCQPRASFVVRWRDFELPHGRKRASWPSTEARDHLPISQLGENLWASSNSVLPITPLGSVENVVDGPRNVVPQPTSPRAGVSWLAVIEPGGDWRRGSVCGA